MKIALYPGSFDPFTNGHLDILTRAARIFDHVIVGVLVHPTKKCLFTPEMRVEMINEVIKDFENVRAIHFNGLLVEFCRTIGACAVIRGLRAVSDYEYELQMFSVNKQLAPELETIFLMSSTQYSFLSSSIAKEVARFGGDVSALVPPVVEAELRRAFAVPPAPKPPA
ncbi:MAG: Phosphopantetheine adenylyltransferase [Candidatus Ozemobacter sibiricus]|jgi:pantetheine-phosphate adenylyltransferase|uniref:Phosphopantetheine adenylyltransferase n=1 Tax=Candidatus Ozemobacter sibiricus TaxID=2268124 RepID=A0A367ZP77_9BACT|nr:MAG: Phosphopantetheine adenylyltransferase [Candidatus Ozemobacter sibiricus]